MNVERLYNNIIDQVKEAQIKLGYVKETIRLYYQVSSINALLGLNCVDIEQVMNCVNNEIKQLDIFGGMEFKESLGRLEISVLPDICEEIHLMPVKNQFLKELIELFWNKHNCTIEDVCGIFEQYDSSYICEKMQDNLDFDYVIHFPNADIDEYYYCVKVEGNHSIYHRFIKEDYEDIR